MQIVRIILCLLMCFPAAVSATDRSLSLDGVQLCVPDKYAPPSPPFWVKLIESDLDNSYTSLYFRIEPKELKKAIPTYKPDTNLIKGERRFTSKGVIVTNISAISGRSQAQDRVIELVRSGEAVYEPSQIPGLLRLPHDESGFHWSLLRSADLPDPLTTLAVHNWIAAFCGKSLDERYDCHLQRIIGQLSYSVSVPDLNMENMGKIEDYIEVLLRSWMGPCKKRT